ncbi:hypothetical protein NE237_005295 [Protea cynaroides]|uniref:Uncharacterized protein n=1 Tax=Protea cynaroides TaxID=273540 RepID=A0A9Q0KL26_9MAGN|nr:hypothetical protein NE237_005295 [Protea cynaroides]
MGNNTLKEYDGNNATVEARSRGINIFIVFDVDGRVKLRKQILLAKQIGVWLNLGQIIWQGLKNRDYCSVPSSPMSSSVENRYGSISESSNFLCNFPISGNLTLACKLLSVGAARVAEVEEPKSDILNATPPVDITEDVSVALDEICCGKVDETDEYGVAVMENGKKERKKMMLNHGVFEVQTGEREGSDSSKKISKKISFLLWLQS